MDTSFNNPTDLPKQPEFEKIPNYKVFAEEFQEIIKEIEALAHHHKAHVHGAGLAINEIIQKLMPFMQKYNMEYTQANIANGQKAASYALAMTNYIANEYKKAGTDKNAVGQPVADKQAAYDAIYAYKKLFDFIAMSKIYGNGQDPFGSMGGNVMKELGGVLGSHISLDNKDVDALANEWKDSWTMNGPKPDNKNGGSTDSGASGKAENSMIMQDINSAQNQVQSEAAYLQSEAKIANQSYQQMAAVQHQVAQDTIGVEKAAVSAAQSAGN